MDRITCRERGGEKERKKSRTPSFERHITATVLEEKRMTPLSKSPIRQQQPQNGKRKRKVEPEITCLLYSCLKGGGGRNIAYIENRKFLNWRGKGKGRDVFATEITVFSLIMKYD